MSWRAKAVRGEMEVQVHPELGWRLTLIDSHRMLNVDHLRRMRHEEWMTPTLVDFFREAGLIVTHDPLPWRWGCSALRYADQDDE